MKTILRKARGFTLIEIMIVVAIIAIILAMAIPVLLRARDSSQKNTCIANLRLMDSAITSWAVEARKSVGSSIDTCALFGPTNLIREQPICPAGGIFT
jgi:prepilin-type N-terminal cleavage/methylation domain-containing protein